MSTKVAVITEFVYANGERLVRRWIYTPAALDYYGCTLSLRSDGEIAPTPESTVEKFKVDEPTTRDIVIASKAATMLGVPRDAPWHPNGTIVTYPWGGEIADELAPLEEEERAAAAKLLEVSRRVNAVRAKILGLSFVEVPDGE